MILHLGERVFWGAPKVIYLEGTIVKLDEEAQSVVVHVDRATPNSAHLIDSDVPFAADGVMPLVGESPAGMTNKHSTEHQAQGQLSDDEKIRSAAAVAVHQKYGYMLETAQEQALIEQVAQVLNSDQEMRTRIIVSMDEILLRGR